MYLLTLILGIVLLHEASTLNCYECIPGENGTCTETITQCPLLENQCAALRVVTYAGGSKVSDDTWKSCVLPEECGEHSVSYGDYRYLDTNKCCISDLYNNQSVPEPSQTENGKKCFNCEGLTCNKTLNCVGNEDYCFSVTGDYPDGTNGTRKGCISKLHCSNIRTAWITRANETGISCCQGDYCNGVSSTTAPTVASTTTAPTTAPTTASTVTKTTRSRGDSTSSTSAGLLLLVTPLISLILN